ncbi:MAG: JAB domain-containing protein, partial [Deltaproteobacteria bacterium]|nr:JAB domain-containing protein [Deltaproteobacteria bacterium]
QVISIGILNKSLVHPREVFVPALERRAAAIVLCHCHPSGDPKPSTQDKEITKRLVEVGKLIGINVLDHLIIGDNGYYSFVDEDVMPA